MSDMIFPKFYEMHPLLNYRNNGDKEFKNADDKVRKEAESVTSIRKELGLAGLTGDLNSLIINTQDENLISAAEEFVKYTGYSLDKAFSNSEGRVIVLKCKDSSDIIIKSRKEPSPFRKYNINPKSIGLPDTRLETFVFECFNIQAYYDIQKRRGAKFMTEGIVETENYYFIQTIPSSFTGNSIGVIQWKDKAGEYMDSGDHELFPELKKPKKAYVGNIGRLDHTASRVQAMDRDSALVEFMELTNYDFGFAIYVNNLNSITNVSRLAGARFAMVFTSGIKSYEDVESMGPTEKFIYNYGIRVHHLAFITDDIDYTWRSLQEEGFNFLSEVVGSEAKGIKQVFSEGSGSTMLVNEYICRYGGFDGFFIEENVELLTKATEKQ